MLTGNYRDHHRGMSDAFVGAIPENLERLGSSGLPLTAGGEHLDRGYVDQILSSNLDDTAKISALIILTGEWVIRNSDSVWTIGPIGQDELSLRLGVGLENMSQRSFIPLTAMAEEVVLRSELDPEVVPTFVAFNRVAVADL